MYAELKRAWNELTSPGHIFEVQRKEVRGVDILTYVHAPNSLRDIWISSANYGDRNYIVYQDERISYREAHRRVAAVAQGLSNMGVRPGDRVAIAMRNYPEWMLAHWAITSIGAVVVGMNAWWVPHEMKYALEDAAPKVLIVDDERMLRFEELRDTFPKIEVVTVRLKRERPDWAVCWESLATGESSLPVLEIDTDTDACIFYTSGTTGRPKGAQLTHRGCISNIMNVDFANAVQPRALAYASGAEPSAESAEPVCALVATPMFHVTANNCVSQPVTMAGGCLVYMYKWDAGEALKLIEREKVSTFSAVPLMSRELIMHPDFVTRDVSSLKTIGGGGAAMQPDLVSKVPEAMPGTLPGTGYGMTETCGVIASTALEFLLDRPTSVGRAMPTFEAKCVDTCGNTLPANEIGELVVRGAPVIRGYLNRPDATGETIVDGWLHTGDMVHIDDDGFIYLVDRAKDMVLRGGENVYCAEVENALYRHEAVAECVAFAVPDERLGEEVGAALYLKPGESLDAAVLRKHCKNYLSPFKVPRYIWMLPEPLPRNANGKFVKRALQESLMLADAV